MYCENDASEIIHTDFDFSEMFHEPTHITVNAFSRVNGGQWGNYQNKPNKQTKWEKRVKNEIDKIMVEDGETFPHTTLPTNACKEGMEEDTRPHLLDPATQHWQLVDTGAVVSVWPKKDYPDAICTPNMLLEAVNGSRLCTFGKRIRQVKIGRKSYSQEFILADIKAPILGWNFIKGNALSLIWDLDGLKMDIVDRKAQIRANLRLGKVEAGTLLGLKVISAIAQGQEVKYRSFQEWSQAQNLLNQSNPPPIGAQYQELINKYPDLTKYDFTTKEAKHGVTHHIDTGNNSPCQSKVRPIIPGSPKAIQGKKNWDELEELGIVERVGPHLPTNWSSPIHLQPKPDGSLRPCGDFRGLNGKTILDKYPLPNINHFNSKIKGAKIFSKVDLVKAYHAIPLDEESQRKCTVLTPWGTYMFKRLPMGLRNSAQSFQKLIDSVLAGMDNVFAYMDDVLVYSENEQDHLKTLEELFRRLCEAGLPVSLKKCAFGQSSIDFLGYHVDEQGITPLPKKLKAIIEYPSPTKAKELLGFLGALNYYRKTLPKIDGKRPAEILQPLYEAATKKAGPGFKTYWKDNDMESHYQNAKRLIMAACQLEHPDPNAPLAITTDASKYALGGVLEQYTRGQWRPLGFWSRHLKADKSRWTTFRRELLAIKDGIRHFISEIDGRQLTVYTDHKPILGAFDNPSSQQYDAIAMNHLEEIGQRTGDIRYLPGKSNGMADWLSRADKPTGTAYEVQTEQLAAVQKVATEIVSHKKIAEAQESCAEIDILKTGKHPPDLAFEEVHFSQDTKVFCEIASGTKARPVVPTGWRKTIINLLHKPEHPGQKGTLQKVERAYYWQTMAKDVAKFVSECHTCQSIKVKKTIQPPIKKRPVIDERFQSLQVDVVGPLPVSEGMRYLFTIWDTRTRWLEAIPMADASAITCAMAMIRGWIKNFGIPRIILSDNGNTFIADIWKEVHKQLGSEVEYTPPYHASSLGGVERQHRHLKDGLKAALMDMGDKHGSKWMQQLPWVLLGKRTQFQPALDCTAAEMVLGSNPTIPGDLIGEPGPPIEGSQLKELLETLRTNAAKPPVPMTHNRDPPINYPDLSKVTHVYIRKGKTTPLGVKFEGPFEITERLGASCIRVRVGSHADGSPRLEVQHWNNCKPAVLAPGAQEGQKAVRGRPRKEPDQPQQEDNTEETPAPMPNAVAKENGNSPQNVHTDTNARTDYALARPERQKRAPQRYGH